MRIAHVVTYVSADGAFGGPLTVATQQCRELVARGHDVHLVAGWDGKPSQEIPGVQQHLFRATKVGPGLSGLVSPGLVRWVRSNAGSFDAIHIHSGRDLVSTSAMRAIRSYHGRLILQTHGMIMPDERLKAQLVDRLVIRAALSQAASVLSLSDAESNGLRSVARSPINLMQITNGITRELSESTKNREQDLVIFLARLHPRKRVMAFVSAAKELLARGDAIRFEIWGPDEGDLPELENALSSPEASRSIVYRGPVQPGLARDVLSRAAVYVLPSYGEVFPMTVLEAMAAGTAVVTTHDSAIADRLASENSAVITDGTPETIATAIHELVADPLHRSRVVESANHALDTWLGIGHVVDQLEAIYQ
ncbi:glycosyltransferase [Microbacterium sp. A1-JK]|uniref:glycosyltransferase n=1 Tax=Microbacterium sp. A1-JK TaxID=3177516 RepID=UPI003886D0B1